MKDKPFWSRVKLNRRDLSAKGSPTLPTFSMIRIVLCGAKEKLAILLQRFPSVFFLV
jgi:hypothetical protein